MKHYKVESQVIEDYTNNDEAIVPPWTYSKFKGGDTYYVTACRPASAIAKVTRLIYNRFGAVMVGEGSAYIEIPIVGSVVEVQDPYELSHREQMQMEYEGKVTSPANRTLVRSKL